MGGLQVQVNAVSAAALREARAEPEAHRDLIVRIAGYSAPYVSLPIGVQPASVVLAVVISASIGIFFGIYPARRAAALNPIDALRYE